MPDVLSWLKRALQRIFTDRRRIVSVQGNASGVATAAGDIHGNVNMFSLTVPTPQPPATHTLRAPVADFTGRSAEIDALVGELSQPGVAALISSLHGMGGVGKTELALVVAQRLSAAYPDAQLFFELQPGGLPLSPEMLLAQAIHAFRPEAVLPDALGELQPLYRAALQGHKGLLLLDNAAGPDQVRALLPPPPGWAVLVTSRLRFALPGSWLHDLDVLPEAGARAFLQRLLAATGRHATDDEITRLARLCTCLPLALRLAAGYLAAAPDWTVPEYLGALDKERLPRLAAGDETVAAVLGLSVTRLEQRDPALAHRWRQLAVFPAPLDRAAAAAVWELDQHATRVALSTLVSQSLLDHDRDAGTYSVHDLLRECAVQPIADGAPPPAEDPALRLRHAWHYLELGRAADDLYEQGGEHMLEGLRAFDALWPHLDGAWSWLSARPDDDAVASWLTRLSDGLPHLLDLRLPPRRLIPIFEAGLAAARRVRDRRGEGNALGNMGSAYAALGDARRGIELYEQALLVDREIGDRRGEGADLGNMGNAYARLGDARRAIELYEQQLAIVREIGDRRGECAALGNMGLAYADLGDARRAIELYDQRLAIAREIGDRRGEGNALGNMGLAYARLGDARRAIELYEQALLIEREIGDRRGEGADLGNMGSAYARLGDARRAIELYEQALLIAREIGDGRAEAIASWNAGVAYGSLGDFSAAAALTQATVDCERSVGDPDADKHAERLEEVRRKAASADPSAQP